MSDTKKITVVIKIKLSSGDFKNVSNKELGTFTLLLHKLGVKNSDPQPTLEEDTDKSICVWTCMFDANKFNENKDMLLKYKNSAFSVLSVNVKE